MICLSVSINHFAQTNKPISLEAFLNEPLGVKETVKELSTFGGIKFKVKKEAVPNLHDPAVVDTVYHFQKRQNSIKFFKGKHNSFVYEATFTSKKAKLTSGIRPGMKRVDFYQALKGVKDTGEKAQVLENAEKTAKATVTFKRNKLKRITLEYSVD